MLTLGARSFTDDRLLVMAIINRTPDSFHDRGAAFDDRAAARAVEDSLAAGADIVDIGGVKAGPGQTVTLEEELRRTVDFVRTVRARYPELVISVDTWRSEVAEAVCLEGADLINDAWGGVDPDVARVAGRHGVGLVCTHAGGQAPRTRPHRVQYADVVEDIVRTTGRLVDLALAAGVPRSGLVIDPGHDFGKNTRQSLLATAETERLVDTGWPVLMSLSRKDFVGETLDVPDTADRLTGTLAATAVTAWLGARIWRVHDVGPTRQTIDMVQSIRGIRPPTATRRGLA